MRGHLAFRPRGQFLAVCVVQCLRAESRFTGWIAPLWILALIGLLFLPTEYRGGASVPHSHALLQLLLDAQDGHFQHSHAHGAAGSSLAIDWLDPAVTGNASSTMTRHPDVGQQQESAPALSVITFLVVLPLLPIVLNVLPRVSLVTPRLRGHSPRVLFPPPRFAATSA